MPANPKTAEEGNPTQADYHSGEASAAGENAEFGAQIKPETQLTESDGNRTYANPVPDPGPGWDAGYKHPNNSEKTIRAVNEPLKVTQRTSTMADHHAIAAGVSNTSDVELPPELKGGGIASDVYNPEKGKNLTDMVEQAATKGRELAPQSE